MQLDCDFAPHYGLASKRMRSDLMREFQHQNTHHPVQLYSSWCAATGLMAIGSGRTLEHIQVA